VDRDRLLLGLAAVFTGLAAALAVAALAVQPFLLLLAIPFGLTAYFMWHQATGRLAARARAREERTRRAASDRGPGAGEGPRGGPWTDGDGPTGDGRGRGRGRRTAPTATETLSRREAYRTLGLAPGADADAVRGAYRERVKEVHPDAETGDEEAFKRVNRAYERLRE
jgi:DnaJ-domain-containing protein 1